MELESLLNNTTKQNLITKFNLYSVNTVPKTTENTSLENYDSTEILFPAIVGFFVVLILGWMLIRYKMSAHQRSYFNDSIYCCPDKCYDFCAKFCECKIR